MKNIFVIILAMSLMFFSSCCKSPYPIAGVMVSYPDLSDSETLKAIRTNRSNLSIIVDTINLGDLHLYNNFSAFIEFNINSPNYIIFVENTSYIDTISDIMFERKKGCSCKEKIINFEYKFNGQKQTKTDDRIIIR